MGGAGVRDGGVAAGSTAWRAPLLIPSRTIDRAVAHVAQRPLRARRGLGGLGGIERVDLLLDILPGCGRGKISEEGARVRSGGAERGCGAGVRSARVPAAAGVLPKNLAAAQ